MFLKDSALVLTSLGLAASEQPSLAADNSKAFSFLHICDPQLFWGSEKSWQQAIACANRLRPAFVVIGGDLINNKAKEALNHDFSEDQKMLEAYLKGTAMLDPAIPLYNVAGNHDVCNAPTPETLDWYTKQLGAYWYSFTFANSLFLVLQSDVLKNPENAPTIAEEQMKWLKSELESWEGKPLNHKMVFLHHPMCLKRVDEEDQYFNMPKALREELLVLFRRHGVTATFSGHLHRNRLVKEKEMELITTASSGKALGDDPLGMRIVDVFPDHIEHNYYGFEDIPYAKYEG